MPNPFCLSFCENQVRYLHDSPAVYVAETEEKKKEEEKKNNIHDIQRIDFARVVK
jgi:hypothetical protein